VKVVTLGSIPLVLRATQLEGLAVPRPWSHSTL